MNLQIETLTLADGSKVDVVRDIEKVRKLIAEVASKQASIELHCRDWAEDHTHLQNLCREVGCTEAEVDGDGYGVPTTAMLGDMLKAKVDTLRARIAELEDWKAGAMRVIGDWDVAFELVKEGAQLGGSMSAHVVKKIREQQARIAELEEFVDDAACGWSCDGDCRDHGKICEVCRARELLKKGTL